MPQIALDHPLTRHSTTCPLCFIRKDRGLLVCWSCYRAYDIRNGNPQADAIIEAFERQLAEPNPRIRP